MSDGNRPTYQLRHRNPTGFAELNPTTATVTRRGAANFHSDLSTASTLYFVLTSPTRLVASRQFLYFYRPLSVRPFETRAGVEPSCSSKQTQTIAAYLRTAKRETLLRLNLDPWKHRLMAGVVRDRLTRWSACSACALAFWIAGMAAGAAEAQAPAYPSTGPGYAPAGRFVPAGPALSPAGPMPGELAPPNVPPPAGAPGSAPYRPATPEVIGPPAGALRPEKRTSPTSSSRG